jgi:phosphonate transport system substrate-binding protein
MNMLKRVVGRRFLAALLICFFGHVAAQTTCANRGDLDVLYCDENRDLLADSPTAAQQLKPATLMIGMISIAESAEPKVYEPFFADLSRCLKMPVKLWPSFKEADLIEAMRNRELHVMSMSTGAMMFAVNLAGAVPFAGKGRVGEKTPDAYQLLVISKKGRGIDTLQDLNGRRVAHSAPTSNSGNLAPRALLPAMGITPDRDYTVVYSGKHDKSVLGVQYGFWDAAAVASGVFERMDARGAIRKQNFNVLYRSGDFPRQAFAYSHALDTDLVARIKRCYAQYQFPSAMVAQLEGANRFMPVDYLKDWQVVRDVAIASGQKMDRASYLKSIGLEDAAKAASASGNAK